MSLTDTIFSFALNLLYQWNYPGVFLLMTLEGATFPVPSEVVLPLTGFLVYQGKLEFCTAVWAATLGSLLGTLVHFGTAAYLGRPAVLRYGTQIRLNERNLMTTERRCAANAHAP